jgi:glutaredoxin
VSQARDERGVPPGRAGAGRDPAARGGPPIVLYRCPTRTDVLCPCGAVARRLRRLGLEHRVVRLPYRRSSRPEIEELNGQRRIPVIVDGDEVVHDSKRILEYLDWAYGGDVGSEGGARLAGRDA